MTREQQNAAKELIKVYQEYIKFLDEKQTPANSIAYIHGFKYDPEDIQYGINQRNKIKELLKIVEEK